jgi:hypothetical protein
MKTKQKKIDNVVITVTENNHPILDISNGKVNIRFTLLNEYCYINYAVDKPEFLSDKKEKAGDFYNI